MFDRRDTDRRKNPREGKEKALDDGGRYWMAIN